MDKIDQLFIRACKSGGNEIKKIEKLYKRFYLNRENIEVFVAGVLTRLADQYLKLKPSDMIYAFNPAEAWRYGIEAKDSHDMRTIKILKSKIAFTHKERFQGLSVPSALRRRNQA
jgi:hypothetical protein